MLTPDVSIILPTFNRLTYLREAIDSVLAQTYTDWELIIADDMHSRKKILYEKCDAAIILPGGIGTLDELFELLTWNQLNIHNKKVFLLNTNGFYTALLEHMSKMHEEGFLYTDTGKNIIALSSIKELETILA